MQKHTELGWRDKACVLGRRLVESWTRIGLLLLFASLVGLGILVVRPRRQGRRMGIGSTLTSRNTDEVLRHDDKGPWDGAQRGMESDGVSGSPNEASMGVQMGGKARRREEDDWLDVEDTCVLQ